jgi:hypothetical protein
LINDRRPPPGESGEKYSCPGCGAKVPAYCSGCRHCFECCESSACRCTRDVWCYRFPPEFCETVRQILEPIRPRRGEADKLNAFTDKYYG